MHTIIRRAINIPATQENDEQVAARALGVEIKNEATTPHACYGASQRYSQIFWTTCGNNLVISADIHRIDASLCTGDFDWDADVYNEEQNFAAMDAAAGLAEAEGFVDAAYTA